VRAHAAQLDRLVVLVAQCTPQTWSWPLIATGVPPPPPPVVVPVIAADFGDSLPAASYAATVHWYVVLGARPVTVNEVAWVVPTAVAPA
jgi:hypothetical protein